MGNEGVWRVTGTTFYKDSKMGTSSGDKQSFLVLACNVEEAIKRVGEKLGERGLAFSQVTGVELLGELL